MSMAFRKSVGAVADEFGWSAERRAELQSEARLRTQMVHSDEMTKQEFKAECDINNIIRRFHKDGFLRHMAQGMPQFLDVSELGDYRTAIDQVRAAERWFSQLPAKVRTKFDNDAAAFLDRAGHLTRSELRDLGLAELRAGDIPRNRRGSDVEEIPPGNNPEV